MCAQESVKRKRKHDEELNEMPENVPFHVRNGLRFLSPYWSIFRSWAKGRWVGRRLVDVFTDEFLGLNEYYVQAALKMGRIWINGSCVTDTGYIFGNNDAIIHIGHRHEHPILDRPLKFIENNDDLLVIDKPPGLPVHPCGNYRVHTVLGMLREQHGITGLKVVHRLDRTTSGVLILAKNLQTDLKLKETLQLGEWHKEYICQVEGNFPDEEVICDRPIGPLALTLGIQCVRDDGKSSLTKFKKVWGNGKISVLRCHLATGRTHQIRVHLQYLGYPISDDYIYNSTAWGPLKGKGSDYGKSYDELKQSVLDNHKASNWLDESDRDYINRLKRIVDAEVKPDPEGLSVENRPSYDPICLSCNVAKKEPPLERMMLHLHCVKYETSEWTFTSDMPEWAYEPKSNTTFTTPL